MSKKIVNSIKGLGVALILLVILLPSVILASDISGSKYFSNIAVTNNSTATTNVAVPITGANTTNFQAGGYLNASANNCVMRNTSGADVKFQPGYTPGAYPWNCWVPTIGGNSILTNVLYFAESTGGHIRYFPADGGKAVSDNATIELSDNFTIEQKGWVDTSAGANKSLVRKDDAFDTIISAAGNITSAIRYYDGFTADAWTDVGTKITVNIGNTRIDYEAEMSAVDNRCYYDMTSISDTEWELNFTWNPTSHAGSALFYFGLFDATANPQGYGSDYICIRAGEDTVRIIVSDGGGTTLSPTFAHAYATTYYVTLERKSSILVALSVFTDAARTTHLAGSPEYLAIPATVVGLRYIQASNQNNNTNPALEEIGWITDVGGLELASVTATGISSADMTVTTTANVTNMWIEIDSVVKDTVALGGISVPNNANDWAFVETGSMLYMEYTSIDIDGTPTAKWEWEYSDTFTDSISGIVATPSFRTANSDVDVSANLTSFQPVAEATAPAYALEPATDFIDPAMTGNMTGGFTTTPPAGTFPLAGVITAVANATGTPPQLPLLILAAFMILAVSLSFSYFTRLYGSGPILLKILLIAGMMGIFVGIGNFGIDFWMVVFFLMGAPAFAFGSRQGRW